VVERDDDNLFQITERRLKEGVSEGLRSSYLTALSIIQGVAFATLIFNGADAAEAAIKDDPKVSVFFLIIISFGNLILVWFEYSWLIRFRTRHPMFIDALIPFLVGAGEVAPTFFFNNPFWWTIATILFLAVSILAYRIPFKYMGPQTFENINGKGPLLGNMWKRRYVVSMSLLLAVIVLLGVLAFWVFLTGRLTIWEHWLIGVSYGMIFVTAYIFLIWSFSEVSDEVLATFGVPVGNLHRPFHRLWHMIRLISCAPCHQSEPAQDSTTGAK
jgi:hypothetical protein